MITPRYRQAVNLIQLKAGNVEGDVRDIKNAQAISDANPT